MIGLDTVGSMALNVGIIIISLFFFGSFGGLIGWIFFRWKKYSQFTCVVWGRDGFGQLSETSDTAGIFVDRKTKNKRFFLRWGNVGLDPNNVPYVKRGKKKIVYLLKKGLKNYCFINPIISKRLLSNSFLARFKESC